MEALNAKPVLKFHYTGNEESLKAFKNTQMSSLSQWSATFSLHWIYFLSHEVQVFKGSA